MPQNPSAKFQINDRFRITNRGLVFSGDLIEGMISPGDMIEFEANKSVRRRRITSVDRARSSSPDPKLGVMIECLNEEEMKELHSWEPGGQIAYVYPADGGESGDGRAPGSGTKD